MSSLNRIGQAWIILMSRVKGKPGAGVQLLMALALAHTCTLTFYGPHSQHSTQHQQREAAPWHIHPVLPFSSQRCQGGGKEPFIGRDAHLHSPSSWFQPPEVQGRFSALLGSHSSRHTITLETVDWWAATIHRHQLQFSKREWSHELSQIP